MAEHADGSIIIDTEIDAQGFKSGSSELQRAIQSLNTKIQSLGPAFQKSLSGNSSAISAFDAKASALEGTIAELEIKMESIGSKRVPTEDYQWLTTEIEKAKNELSKLYDKQIKMETVGVEQNSRAWRSLQYDIELARRKISDYTAEQTQMRANGTAFQLGTNTVQYKQLETALASATNKLAQMRTEASGAGGATSRLAAVGNTIKGTFSKIGAVSKKAFSKVGSTIKGGITKMRQFAKQSSRASYSMNSLSGKMKMMAMMIKQMLVMRAFMGILTAVGDGLKNLSQYSSQTNKDLSTLKSALTQLKNSFATAFAPILTAVAPALATLINYLVAAITYVGKFVAALTGAKTFTKATAVQEDFAASLGETGSAAEKAKKQLAGFDELNVLSDSSSDGGGGGAGSASPSEMFEEVPIESNITDFVGKLKEAFKNGDYAGIGEIIGNGINTAVQKVNDFISWDNLGQKITNGVKASAQCFNAIVDTVDWENIGDTFAQGFNTAINTLFLVLTEFDWPGLAAGMARSLNGLVSGIDWGKLGTTLSTGLSTAIATLRSAITTFDWASLGSSISTAINNIDWAGLLSDLAGGISDILKGALDLLIGFAENLDWGKLGRDLWNGLIGIITNIDWNGIISEAFRLLGGVIGGRVASITEFCKSVWTSLKSGFEDTKSYFNRYIEDAGGNIIKGIWEGITNALKNVGSWIVDNIWNPFIEGFKNAFGIHSPSTKMAEMGGYIVEGLLNGIKGAWDTVTGFFSTTFENIKTTISNTWNNVKTGTITVWNSIKTSLSTTWSNIKSTASTAWSNLKSTISTKWTEIKNNASSTWNGIKSTLSSKWDGIKSTASSKWDSIKSTINNKGWSDVGSNICNGIKSGIDSGWEWLKNTVGNLATSLLDKAKSVLGIHSPSRLFRDIVGLNIGYGIGEGIEASEGSVVKTVTGLADAIAAEANAGEYNIGGVVSTAEVDRALIGFSDKVASSFTSLLDRLQAIAEGVTFSVPAMATGTIVPYSVSASAVGSDVASAIELSNLELGSIIIQTVSNATATVVNAIQDYGGAEINIDSNSLTTAVVNEINRRTRMGGKSPLLI